jgi:hypothetical protein
LGTYKFKIEWKPAHNIVLAIVGLTVINSTFELLSGICANVGLTFFKCPTIANTWTVVANWAGSGDDPNRQIFRQITKNVNRIPLVTLEKQFNNLVYDL